MGNVKRVYVEKKATICCQGKRITGGDWKLSGY